MCWHGATPHAIATSGYREAANVTIQLLAAGPEVPVITRDQV